jgi:hypothetical protein
MDFLLGEAIHLLLGHLNEHERVRLLCTCKKLGEWLQKRKAIAEASFNGLKAHLHEINDGEREARVTDDGRVVISYQVVHPRGVNRHSCEVQLQNNRLIRIVIKDSYRNAPSSTWTKVFSPWSMTMITNNGKESRIKDDMKSIHDLQDLVLPMLTRDLSHLVCYK